MNMEGLIAETSCGSRQTEEDLSMGNIKEKIQTADWSIISEEQLEELFEIIKEVKAEQNEETGIWMPERLQEYLYINSKGQIVKVCNVDENTTTKNAIYAGIFKTEEEAEFEKKRREVFCEMKKFSKPFKVGEANATISLDHVLGKLSLDSFLSYEYPNNLYFSSTEKARECIDTVGEDRIKKYVFGVE